jgi:hypothetical protein
VICAKCATLKIRKSYVSVINKQTCTSRFEIVYKKYLLVIEENILGRPMTKIYLNMYYKYIPTSTFSRKGKKFTRKAIRI